MRRLLLPLLVCFGAGCAAQVPSPAPGVPAPPAAAPARPAAPPRATGNGARAGIDSLPSQDAIAVLGSIPEPLSTAQTIEPPARAPIPVPAPVPVPVPVVPIPSPASSPARPAPSDTGVTMLAPEAAYDTLRASTEDVPVPGSTRPLGVAPAPPALAPPQASAPVAAEPDTCWRLQVAAPAERAKAVSMQSAARSLLLVPMVIVRDAGRYKVRSEECLARSAAEALRDRAVATGFSGVFLVREVRRSR